MSVLYSSGLHHVLSRYLGHQVSPEERQVQQECAWRLQQWDQLCPDTARASVPGCVLGALEGVARGDQGALTYWRLEGEGVVRKKLRGQGLETCSALHPLLTQLRQLGELQVLGSLEKEELDRRLPQLQARDATRAGKFSWLEPVLSLRQAVVASRPSLAPLLAPLVLHSSRLARRSGAHWVCGQQYRYGLAPGPQLRWEEALVAWAQGQRDTGIALAKGLLQELEREETPQEQELLPQVLLRLGKWLHHQKTETPRTILNNFLTRSVQLLEGGQGQEEAEQLVQAHLALAGFADMQFKHVSSYSYSCSC